MKDEQKTKKQLIEELNQTKKQNRIIMKKLRKQQELNHLALLSHTLDSIREAVSITDLEDNVIYLNLAFLKMYGFEKDELTGKNISVIRSDRNNAEIVSRILPETLNSGCWEGELYNCKKDGTEFLISLHSSVVRDENGEPIALVGSCIDITDKKRAELSLKESEEKYHSLFENIKDVVYVTSPDGKFIDLNPAGLDLFGYSSIEELLKADIPTNIYQDPNARNQFKADLEKNGFVKNYESYIRTKDGRDIIALETSTLVKDREGKVVAYRGILRDITEVKRAEQELKRTVEELEHKKYQLEKSKSILEQLNQQLLESENELKNLNASKDKFFAILAHDLRSPFTSLIGLSSIVINDFDNLSKDEIKSFSVNINRSAKNVFNLLENLLQWSRIQTGRMEFKPEKIDLYEAIHETVNLIIGNAVKKNIDIVTEVALGSYVLADRNMLNSVLQNITSNAVKFTYPGGKIKLSAVDKNGIFELNITDSGMGIKPADLSKLFRIDVHHTTTGTGNEKGTGLGLILCKELIERNRGTIRVESEYQKGSSFIFTLPSFISEESNQ